jgi:hypothetical protein
VAISDEKWSARIEPASAGFPDDSSARGDHRRDVDRGRAVCAECCATSAGEAEGWRAYLDVDDEAVTFCPELRGEGVRRAGLTLCEALDLSEIDRHAGLVPDDPCVVTRRHGKEIAGANLRLGAVVHGDVHSAREDVTQVVRLAAIGAGNWLHVLRPSPSRLVGGVQNCMTADVDDRSTSLVLRE